MGLLDHKTAVITGANSGIGLSAAERFIAEGAEKVFITGRRQLELDSAAKQLGSHAIPVCGDVGKPEDLDRLYAEVEAAGKGLDVVMANAGSTRVSRLGEIRRRGRANGAPIADRSVGCSRVHRIRPGLGRTRP